MKVNGVQYNAIEDTLSFLNSADYSSCKKCDLYGNDECFRFKCIKLDKLGEVIASYYYVKSAISKNTIVI